MTNISSNTLCVGVVGAGSMGQGIAQVSAMAGIKTLLVDAEPDNLSKGSAAIKQRIHRLVEKGKMSKGQGETATSAITQCHDLGALSEAHVVIEAIFEDLDLKQRLFRDLEAIVAEDCLLATNTSSIPVAAIAQALTKRSRAAGMHFFNPVPLMRLVEIVKAPDTHDTTVAALTELGRRFGRVPVSVKDAPGFLVNTGGRAYTTEGLRIAHEGVATPAQIDAIMRDCAGFRMGPFELMDLTGIDVNFPVSKLIYEGYMQDPRFRTSPLHEELFNAGRFGRKTGQGHFRYDETNQKIDPPSPDHVPSDGEPATRVAYAGEPYLIEPFAREIGLDIVDEADTTEDLPILCAPMGEDVTEFSLRNHVSHKALVAVDLSVDTMRRVTLMTAPGADTTYRDMVARAIIASGRTVTAIKDSPGFVAQRLRAMIGNLGCYMAEVGLATPDDIDTAMKLGLNYPLGPFEIIDAVGVMDSYSIIGNIHKITGEERYRPTLWLRRRAELDLPITLEN